MENSDILGTLLPLMMIGSSFKDILKALGGSGRGASNMDGLRAMMNTSLSNARMYYPAMPSQNSLNKAFETVVDRFGADPYTSGGQGAVSLLRAAYAFSPDIIGGLAGIPNSNRFFKGISSSSFGISTASGMGLPDFANPYSVADAQRRAMSVAHIIHGLSTNKNGGYDVDYTYGLNMEEVGKVSQRLLSSRIAYRKLDENFAETGGTYNPESKDDAEKFKDHLKKLGEKFNETVSMLSKVTGSVDEALNVMDRLGGGNFLGGTAQQASEIATRAKKMAATIRITSAMAGMSPTEAYGNMSNLQLGMAGGMGMSQYIARASGFAGMMGDIAYNATAGFSAWAAMNPEASIQQKAAALLAVNGRAQAYSSENGSSLASLIADYRDSFTNGEMAWIKSEIESGHPENVAGFVRDKLGSRLYDEHMNNPAMNIASRNRAMKDQEGGALLRELDSLGVAANLEQAESAGARKMINIHTRDLDDKLNRLEKGNYRERRNEEVRKMFAQKLLDEEVMTEEQANSYNLDQIREIAMHRYGGDVVAKEENSKLIEISKEQIQGKRMSDDQEDAARNRLVSVMNRMGITEKAQKEIKDIKDGAASLDKFLKEHVKAGRDRDEIRREVTGGMFFQGEADRELEMFRRVEENQRKEYTAEEKVSAIVNEATRKMFSESIRLKGLAGESNKEGGMIKFGEGLKGFIEKNKLYDKNESAESKMSEMYSKASYDIAKELVKDELGGIKGDELEKINKYLAEGEGKDYLGNHEDSKKVLLDRLEHVKKNMVGDNKNAKDAIDSLVKSVNSDTFDARSSAFALRVTSIYDSYRSRPRNQAVEWLKKASEVGFKGVNLDELFESLSATGLYKSEDIEKIREKAMEMAAGGDVASAARWAIGGIQGKGIRDDSYYAITSTRSPDKAGAMMAALMYRSAGGDVRDIADQLGIDEKAVAAISSLDKSNAKASMNAISNFWGEGNTSFAQEAVKGVDSQLERLKKAIADNGISTEEINKAFVNRDEESLNKIKKAIGEGEYSGKDLGLLGTIAKGGGDLEKSMFGIVTGENGADEKFKKEKEKEGFNEEMIGVLRKAGQNGSLYETITSISGFLETISRFVQNPTQTFNVRISD